MRQNQNSCNFKVESCNKERVAHNHFIAEKQAVGERIFKELLQKYLVTMEIEQVTAFSNEATMQQDIGTNVAAAMPTAAATPQITTSVASTAQPGSTIRRVTLSPDPETASPAPKRARTKRVPLGPLEFPTDDEKKKALAEFQNPADRALQKLLWAINCRYTLLPHQPEAVRAIAGLPASFPHHSAMDNSTDKMSVAETFRAFPIESKTKGILCADEMGLGTFGFNALYATCIHIRALILSLSGL